MILLNFLTSSCHFLALLTYASTLGFFSSLGFMIGLEIYLSGKPRRLLGLAFIGRNKAHSRRCPGPQKHEAHLPYRKSIGERAYSFRAALRITHPDWACRRVCDKPSTAM